MSANDDNDAALAHMFNHDSNHNMQVNTRSDSLSIHALVLRTLLILFTFTLRRQFLPLASSYQRKSYMNIHSPLISDIIFEAKISDYGMCTVLLSWKLKRNKTTQNAEHAVSAA